METLIYEKKSIIPCPAEVLFRWHEHPDAFRRLLPPGEPVTVLHHDGHIRDGARATLRIGHPPFTFRWQLQHCDYEFGRRFCDVQIRGPFSHYRHEHRMVPIDGNRSVLHDRIEYAMPLGMIGKYLGKWIMMHKFERLFTFRHKVTLESLS